MGDSRPTRRSNRPVSALLCCSPWRWLILYNLEKEEVTLPVYSEIGVPEHIENICGLMEKALEKGQKVLFVVVEGMDGRDFSGIEVNNQRDWYTYSSYNLYYTLVTGKPWYNFDLPPVFDMTIPADFPVRYPLSMQNGRLCTESIARKNNIRSACVGCRSMVSHTIINADITAECFIRSLANMGILIALNDSQCQ